LARVQLRSRRDWSGVVSTSAHRGQEVTLLDLLDRLLAGGVVVRGEITLAAADIDLVQLDLGLLVASIDKALGP
jgi:hypothetical protein